MKRENPDLTEQYPGAGAVDRPDDAGAAEGAAPSEPPEGTETPAKKEKDGKEKKSVGGEILSWVLTILVAVVAALVIRSLVFEPVRVDGESMDDTLANGEIMFVSKFDYSSTWLCLPWQKEEAKENAPKITLGAGPQRFDVVICRYPGRGDTNFVQRVVGLPGETVELRDGYLYIDGERIFKEGDILDYSPLFSEEKTPFTVVNSASESTVLFIPAEELRSFMNAYPEGLIEIARMLDRDRQRFMALWISAG